MKKLEKILSNEKIMPITLLIGFLGWIFKIDFVTIPLLCVYAMLLLISSDDVKNIFPVIICMPFYVTGVENFSDFVVLGISILIVIIGIVFFAIKQFKKKTPMRKGFMFWACVVSLVAYLLGGLIGYFNILHFVIIIALTTVTYTLYWIAINFCKDMKKYMAYSFIAIGIMLFVMMFISYGRVDEPFFDAILSKNVIHIGLQNINVVAIYFMLSMVSVLYLGFKHKYDYLYMLAGCFYAVCTYFTYSRMGVLICVIALIAILIYMFIKSSNKKVLLIIGGSVLLSVAIFFAICHERIFKLLDWYLTLGFSGNGRGSLWPWCWEKFLESPVLGVGFVSLDDPVPALQSTDTIILAHNTLLQYLTSCGVVGTILMSFFYFRKYVVLCTKFNNFKFFNLMHIVVIALSGITDQSPAMDVFMITITFLLISLAENDTREYNQEEKDKQKEVWAKINSDEYLDNVKDNIVTIDTYIEKAKALMIELRDEKPLFYISTLQAHLSIGYPKALRIMEYLERDGFIKRNNGDKGGFLLVEDNKS